MMMMMIMIRGWNASSGKKSKKILAWSRMSYRGTKSVKALNMFGRI